MNRYTTDGWDRVLTPGGEDFASASCSYSARAFAAELNALLERAEEAEERAAKAESKRRRNA